MDWTTQLLNCASLHLTLMWSASTDSYWVFISDIVLFQLLNCFLSLYHRCDTLWLFEIPIRSKFGPDSVNVPRQNATRLIVIESKNLIRLLSRPVQWKWTTDRWIRSNPIGTTRWPSGRRSSASRASTRPSTPSTTSSNPSPIPCSASRSATTLSASKVESRFFFSPSPFLWIQSSPMAIGEARKTGPAPGQL